MRQVKTPVIPKRANQGLLEDNKLMAQRHDALPSENVTLADCEASAVEDPFSTTTIPSNAVANSILTGDL